MHAVLNNKEELIKEKFNEIFKILEIDLEDENNKDTPSRLAKMYNREVFAHRNNEGLADLRMQMTTFNYEGVGDRPITVKDITFFSTCAHHWLPFFGKATVTYIPREDIIGLSKIPRVVKFFSKKPQVQENLTKEVCTFLFNVLSPKYIKVTMEAEHTCVSSRGAESSCMTYTEYEMDWESFKKGLYRKC